MHTGILSTVMNSLMDLVAPEVILRPAKSDANSLFACQNLHWWHEVILRPAKSNAKSLFACQNLAAPAKI